MESQRLFYHHILGVQSNVNDWTKPMRTRGRTVRTTEPADGIRHRGGEEGFTRNGASAWVSTARRGAVRQAFPEIGYSGYATTELEGGDQAYLRDVSNRVDRLVLGR